jgi:hypothetical protein
MRKREDRHERSAILFVSQKLAPVVLGSSIAPHEAACPGVGGRDAPLILEASPVCRA